MRISIIPSCSKVFVSMVSNRILSLLFLLAIMAICVVPCYAVPAKVRLSGEVDKKFRNLRKVLDQLEQTLGDPILWGDFWNKKVPMTGKTGLTNYRFKDIALDLKKYLSDESLEIEFRLTKAVRFGEPAAQTVNKNKIILFQHAGRSPKANIYSDYYLARTIFHELMHVWQYYHWTVIGRFMDYEGFPTETDKHLPKARFSLEEFPDPGATTPVPTVAQTGTPGGRLLETLKVTNEKPEKVKTSFATVKGEVYIIEASGVVSDWADKQDGVDAVWCYAEWRVGPKGEVWDQLRINDKGMTELAGKQIPYNPSHVYQIEFIGDGNPIEFYASDAQWSSSDNHGFFTVKIYGK